MSDEKAPIQAVLAALRCVQGGQVLLSVNLKIFLKVRRGRIAASGAISRENSELLKSDLWLTLLNSCGRLKFSPWRRGCDAENPSFDFGNFAFGGREDGREEIWQHSRAISPAQPFSNGKGVLLVAGPAFRGKVLVPQRGINFCDHGGVGWNLPSVKGPEVCATTKMPAQIAQPGKTRVGGFCHRTDNIKMKNGFGGSGVQLGETPPTGIARARGSISAYAVANEIDVSIFVVSRPMLLKIIKK